VPRTEEVRFVDMCTARGFPALRIGVTDDTGTGDPVGDGAAGAELEVQGQFTVPIAALAAAHTATLPRHFA